ncbi:MAG: patatin-like phospholipase family protein, partial [Solirubrobacterales bacterium]|nr:patatin-like phospholipase family protein [Solirubrobacterales bacterium]
MQRTQQFLERYQGYQEQQLATRPPVEPDLPLTALAIDGGGVRGLIPAALLAEIERRCGRPTWECFDVISGTSTGGLITLGLTVPDGAGDTRWKASDLVEMYRNASRTIFPHNILRTLGSPLFDKYAASGITRELVGRLGEEKLGSARTGVVVTAWNLTHNQPAYFNSAEAGSFFSDPLMREVARATSAAPSYFAPCAIAEPNEAHPNMFVDGGTFANNPAKIAYLALRPPHEPTRPVLLLSLGTGNPVA